MRLITASDVDLVDCGGVGGAPAGSALSLRAMPATLEHALTKRPHAVARPPFARGLGRRHRQSPSALERSAFERES